MGRATGLLLRELWDARMALHIGDARDEAAREAVDWIRSGSSQDDPVEPFHLPADGSGPELERVLDDADILLDCLPGEEAPRMAGLARRHRLHYANLTEHVEETEEIQRIAAGAEQGYILQTGLAPGFVNVLAHRLFQDFCRQHGVSSVDRIAMRVGALTSVAEPPHYYAFTWSTIGVATEYVQPSRVVQDFETIAVPSLEGVRPILINGVLYEEALTSGGAADLPTALQGRVRNLDYKTLRYPGHYAWVKALLAEAPAGVDQIEYLHRRMLETVPLVDNDDLVVIFAAVEGRDPDGVLRRHESLEGGASHRDRRPPVESHPVDHLRRARRVGAAPPRKGPPGRLPAEPDRRAGVHGRPVRRQDLRLIDPLPQASACGKLALEIRLSVWGKKCHSREGCAVTKRQSSSGPNFSNFSFQTT